MTTAYPDDGDAGRTYEYLGYCAYTWICSVCAACAQTALLWGQLLLVAWNALHLFWSPATGGAAKAHLRVWVALRAVSFALSALQLRHGYPPPAAYTCAPDQD